MNHKLNHKFKKGCSKVLQQELFAGSKRPRLKRFRKAEIRKQDLFRARTKVMNAYRFSGRLPNGFVH